MAGGIGALLADSDGGIDNRNRVFAAIGGGLPGPTGGFGLACPGLNFGFLRLRLSES
jgi:hypothetical protein